MRVLSPDRIGIWRNKFLWREENRRTRRKTFGARQEPTTNSTQIWHRARTEPRGRSYWLEASALTTALSLLSRPSCLAMIMVTTRMYNDFTYILWCSSSRRRHFVLEQFCCHGGFLLSTCSRWVSGLLQENWKRHPWLTVESTQGPFGRYLANHRLWWQRSRKKLPFQNWM